MLDIKKFLRKSIYLRSIYYSIQFSKYKKRIDNIVREMNTKKLKQMKGNYSGKRCFIIGNGPSLTTDDLEKLKNEITFGSNGIYRVFENTDWRPTFYFVQDSIAFENTLPMINDLLLSSDKVFLSMNFWAKLPQEFIKNPKSIIMYVRYKPPRNSRYSFSEDFSKEVFEGLSVTYTMIQAAVYMGFKEIYLLGVDHNYSIEVDRDGRILKNEDDIQNHFYTLEEEKDGSYSGFPTKINEITNAYLSARDYAEKNNILIKNATRGGKLELFGRTNLENAINERKQNAW